MERLKGKETILVYEAGIGVNAAVKKGINTLLEEGSTWKVIICHRPRSREEVAGCRADLRQHLLAETIETLDIAAVSHQVLSGPAVPGIVVLVVKSSFFLSSLKSSLRSRCREAPVLIAPAPGNRDILPRHVAPLLNRPNLYWAPFGWLPTHGSHPGILVSRTDLWGRACFLAWQGKQLNPYYLEYSGFPAWNYGI